MVVTCANDALRGEFAAIKKFKNEVRFHAFNAQSRWHANNFLSWVKILGKQWETQNNIWWTCSTSDSVSSISWNLSLGPLGHDEMCRLWTSMLYAYVRKPRKSWLFLSLDFLGLMHSIGSLDQRYRNHGHPARGSMNQSMLPDISLLGNSHPAIETNKGASVWSGIPSLPEFPTGRETTLQINM